MRILSLIIIFCVLSGSKVCSMSSAWHDLQYSANKLKGVAKSQYWQTQLSQAGEIPQQLAQFIKTNKNPVVNTAYHWPDLDGIAGAYGLHKIFKDQGTESQFRIYQTPQYEAQWMLQYLNFKPKSLYPGDPSLIALVDTSDPLDVPSFLDLNKVRIVIDHRKYADLTAFPHAISWINPVGSAATLITKLYAHYAHLEKKPDSITSQLLYSAIMSNTISCQTNNTTLTDRIAVEYLKSLGTTNHSLVLSMFYAKSKIEHLKEHLDNDLSSRLQLISGKKTAVAQLEVATPNHFLEERRNELLEALKSLRQERKADQLFLMVLDIIKYKTYFVFLEEGTIFPVLSNMLTLKKTQGGDYYCDTLYTRKEIIALLLQPLGKL